MNSQGNSDDEAQMDWNQAHQQKTDRARSRAIVSVAFSRQDFERLDRHVERRGMKMSEFIREAALDRLASEQAPVTLSAVFASADYYAPQPKAEFSAPTTSGTAAVAPGRFVHVA